jgi:ABC-2 type transport system ATP-binding protein
MEITNISRTESGAVQAAFVISGGADTDTCENGERIFDWAVSFNFKILEMSRRKTSLEDIFVKLTSETAGGK